MESDILIGRRQTPSLAAAMQSWSQPTPRYSQTPLPPMLQTAYSQPTMTPQTPVQVNDPGAINAMISYKEDMIMKHIEEEIDLYYKEIKSEIKSIKRLAKRIEANYTKKKTSCIQWTRQQRIV